MELQKILKYMPLLNKAASITDPMSLRDAVRDAYSKAADNPEAKHSFPVGRSFAESVGYPVEFLDSLPAESVASFTGVSNVSIYAEIPKGAVVVDIGCGAGLDALIAAWRVGEGGTVIGVDFSPSMIYRAQSALNKVGLKNLHFLCSDAERLPVDSGYVDIALINGVFNLNPHREELFSELFRILRKGGKAYVSELILTRPQSIKTSCNYNDWFA